MVSSTAARPSSISSRRTLSGGRSRTTFSAATIAAIDLKQETAALVVGEPSRGKPNGYSDEKHLRLPNSGLEVYYSPLYRAAMPEIGDAPFLPVDIPVSGTFEDYQSGRDPVLEAVLSWTGVDERSDGRASSQVASAEIGAVTGRPELPTR